MRVKKTWQEAYLFTVYLWARLQTNSDIVPRAGIAISQSGGNQESQQKR
jgi:hypothetical protein